MISAIEARNITITEYERSNARRIGVIEAAIAASATVGETETEFEGRLEPALILLLRQSGYLVKLDYGPTRTIVIWDMDKELP